MLAYSLYTLPTNHHHHPHYHHPHHHHPHPHHPHHYHPHIYQKVTCWPRAGDLLGTGKLVADSPHRAAERSNKDQLLVFVLNLYLLDNFGIKSVVDIWCCLFSRLSCFIVIAFENRALMCPFFVIWRYLKPDRTDLKHRLRFWLPSTGWWVKKRSFFCVNLCLILSVEADSK